MNYNLYVLQSNLKADRETYSDSLRFEFLGSFGGSLDDGGVVAAAESSVAGDKDKRDLLHVAHFQDRQFDLFLIASSKNCFVNLIIY